MNLKKKSQLKNPHKKSQVKSPLKKQLQKRVLLKINQKVQQKKPILLRIKDRIMTLNRKVPQPQKQNLDQITALHKKIVHLTPV